MNYKIFFTFSFVLLLIGFVFSNQINYELNTVYPNSSPYYIGTKITDLKISLTDDNKQVIDYSTIPNLSVKLGLNKYTLSKESGVYHLKDIIITNEMLIDNKLIVSVLTPLEGAYTNTKQTYIIDDSSDIIKLKNKPEEQYKVLTIGQQKMISLEFEDLKKQQISNLKCFLDLYDSENIFDCSTASGNICTYNYTVKEDSNGLNIFCYFDKTIKEKKTYPLRISINAQSKEGLKISELVNPQNGVIENPFELCFFVEYANGDRITDLGLFTIAISDLTKDYYLRDNYFCFNYILIPYTALDENLALTFNNKTYYTQITKDLTPGTYWTIFFSIVGLFILINIIFILRAFLSKEDINDLTNQRDNYKNKLKELKEKYLQSEITKKEFDLKLNEYSIKISYLNERLLNVKRQKKNIDSEIKEEKTEDIKDTHEDKPKKAPKELLNAIFSEKKETVELKDEDIIVDETKINDHELNKLTQELSGNFNYDNFGLKENKFITFIKNLFKRKPKEEKQEQSEDQKKVLNNEFNNTFKDNDDYNIRGWQK